MVYVEHLGVSVRVYRCYLLLINLEFCYRWPSASCGDSVKRAAIEERKTGEQRLTVRWSSQRFLVSQHQGILPMDLFQRFANRCQFFAHWDVFVAYFVASSEGTSQVGCFLRTRCSQLIAQHIFWGISCPAFLITADGQVPIKLCIINNGSGHFFLKFLGHEQVQPHGHCLIHSDSLLELQYFKFFRGCRRLWKLSRFFD